MAKLLEGSTPSVTGRPRVLLAAPVSDDLATTIKEKCDVVASEADIGTQEQFEHILQSVDGVVTTVKWQIPGALVRKCTSLQVISNVAVGTDHIDVSTATRCGVLVCNTPGVLDGAVADLTFLFILALARRFRQNDLHVRGGNWMHESAPFGTDVTGKKLGLLGFGRIGAAVAARAIAFDMHVLYCRPGGASEKQIADCATHVNREQLLRESDFVSVHYPLTPMNIGSISTEEFYLMKESAYFINTARGGIVDEPALVDALQRGRIAGAGLDVMEREPIPPDHPLCSLNDVVLTPHIGSATTETRRAMMELAVNNLLSGLADERPPASVNADAIGC